MTRIAVGGIVHETSTYADEVFGTTPIEGFRIERGQRVLDVNRGTGTHIGGFVDVGEARGWDLVGTLWSFAQPSGTIEADAYAAMKDELLAGLADAMPLDGVLLELHGAGVVDGATDLEADLGEAIRALVGPDVPVIACLDLHGNVTDATLAPFDALIGMKLYPHTDMRERGREAAELLARRLDGEARFDTTVVRLPLLIPASTTDPGFPAEAVNRLCTEMEARPGVHACRMFHGFPWADTTDAGTSIVCIAEAGSLAAAADAATVVAAHVWDQRARFESEAMSPEQSVTTALKHDGRPVVIHETNDNCGGGAPGDGTHLLRALLDASPAPGTACFGFIYDPGTVERAIEAGVGAKVDVRLGGHHNPDHGTPIEASAYVKAITDGRFVLETWAPGMAMDHGPMVRLVIGGVDVLVGSRRSQTFEPVLFALHGIDVTRYQVVALKSSIHFRAGFGPIAAAILTSDAPGLTSNRLVHFARRHTDGPMWPLDPATTWSA